MGNPVIVILHGIWHSPATFAKLTTALQKEYEVYVPYFASCIGQRPPTAGLAQDTALVRRLVEQLADIGKSIILVVHSYGGVVGCSAIEGLDIVSRRSAGKTGGVVHFVGLSAHFHPKGSGVFDLVREMGNEDLIPSVFQIDEDGSCIMTDAKLLLFGGLPDDEADALAKTMSRSNINTMLGGNEFEAWRYVPITYVQSMEDVTLPAHYQQRMLDKLEAAGIKAEVVQLPTGHSAYVTMTPEVVKVITDVADRYEA